MPTVDVLDPAGAKQGSVDLDETTFGIEPNTAVMHQVVTAQLAARRSGTQSTKTRSEVAGGGAKPWKQKGTGRARQGSIRSPQWNGGGVALGPKPRSYAQRTPKKMVKLALRSALSDRAAEGKVLVVQAWGWTAPRTKSAAEALAALGAEGRVLVVLERSDGVAQRSFRNLPNVHVLHNGELNAHDVLVSDWVVFTRAALPGPSIRDNAHPSVKDDAASSIKNDVVAEVVADETDAGNAAQSARRSRAEEEPDGEAVAGQARRAGDQEER